MPGAADSAAGGVLAQGMLFPADDEALLVEVGEVPPAAIGMTHTLLGKLDE
jgi:hypothetical protein